MNPNTSLQGGTVNTRSQGTSSKTTKKASKKDQTEESRTSSKPKAESKDEVLISTKDLKTKAKLTKDHKVTTTISKTMGKVIAHNKDAATKEWVKAAKIPKASAKDNPFSLENDEEFVLDGDDDYEPLSEHPRFKEIKDQITKIWTSVDKAKMKEKKLALLQKKYKLDKYQELNFDMLVSNVKNKVKLDKLDLEIKDSKS